MYLLGTRVDMLTVPEIADVMCDWIERKQYHRYVVLSNAFNVSLGRTDLQVREAANASDLCVPDGLSLILAARCFGQPMQRRAYGPELLREFLAISERKGYSQFFYGSTGKCLDALQIRLRNDYPRLKIAGVYAPPFSRRAQLEEAQVVAGINALKPDVLWVGLGGPKQDIWMRLNKDQLKIPVLVGVGAAFDFYSGLKKQAPVWVRNNGLEWLFRLLSEPSRLWKRYLVNGGSFLYYIVTDIVRRRFQRSR